ncbi:MAG TPA: hypothetical protein VMG12_07920 [Polyangiaceae bacterium]|nr:hypothetical protein [Polyangiaceae bacterium]
MAHRLGSVSFVSLFGLVAGVSLCSCGAATDRPALDQQTREATGSESDPGASGDGSADGDGSTNGGGSGAPALDREAALAATWQELGVPGASNGPDIASTPSGWFALSQRTIGDARAPSAWQSYLYRSPDGIRWQSVAISDQADNLWLRGVAYGGGHYVLAGKRMGEGDALFHSTDGEHWQEYSVATGAPSGIADVVFAGGQFFALSTFRTLVRSTNGVDWQVIDLATTVMPLDVAFGRDQFLLVGSGDVQRSSDGLSWQPIRLDCAMPGACISDPSGNVLQGLHNRAVFVAGTYFIDQASSADGVTWQSLPGQYPLANVAGYVVGTSADSALAIWAPGEAPEPLDRVRYVDTLAPADRALRMRWNGAIEPSEQTAENFPDGEPLPETIEFPIASGADCTSATCVTVGNRIYLLAGAR